MEDVFDRSDQMLDVLIKTTRKLAPITTPDISQGIYDYLNSDLVREFSPRPAPGRDTKEWLDKMLCATNSILATAVQRLAYQEQAEQ